MRPDRGQVLGGRYRLERRLGSGGSATAWSADDQVAHRRVALKILDGVRLSETLRNEFLRLRGLHHPNLAHVHDLAVEHRREGAVHYYVADLVDGPPLDVFAESASTVDAVLGALTSALEGLSFLHALGIRHGDFKPANVVVGPDGRGVLIDLGCADVLGRAPRSVCGTPGYIAPELLAAEAGNARSDIFSVGRVMHDILGGRDETTARLAKIATRCGHDDAKKRPATVRELLESLGHTAPSFGPPGGQSPALLGRTREMAEFAEALEALLAGRPGRRALTLVGPSGVGKSRLLREMKWNAQLRCRVVGGDAAEPAAVAAMIGRAAGGPRPRGLEGVLDAHAKLSTADEPTIMVLDDLDACPDAERSAMAALLRVLDPSGRILVLTASAIEVSGIAPLAVEPLDVPAVERWLAPRGLSSKQAMGLHRWTGGFPAEIEAVLARVASEQIAESELESVAARAAHPGRGRALTLEDDDEVRCAALVAALGGAVDLSSTVVEELDHRVLLALQGRGLLRWDRDEIRLRRPSELGAVRDAVGAAAMEDAHGRLATWLENAPSEETLMERSLRNSRRVAHLAGAGRRREALDVFSESRALHEAAPDGWKRAVEALDVDAHPPEPEIVLAASAVLADRGGLEQALSLLVRLLRTRPSATWQARCRVAIGAILLRRGDSRRAVRQLERALETLDPAETPTALDPLARALVRLGEYAEAKRRARQGLAHPDASAPLRGALHETVGVASMYLGDVDTARAELDEAIRVLPTESPPRTLVRVLSYRGIVDFRAGDLDSAIRHYRRVVEVAERHGLADQLATAAMNLATAMQQRGDWGGALHSYERALRLAVALDSSEVAVRFNLANLWSKIGLFDRTEEAASRVMALAKKEGRADIESMTLALLADCALGRGDSDRARSLYERALLLVDRLGAEREKAEIRLGRHSVALFGGDADERARCLDEAERALARVDADDLKVRLALQRAEGAIVDGRETEAIDLLEEAAERARTVGERHLAAEVEAMLERAAAAAGAQGLAASHRRRARATFDRIGVSLPSELRDAFWAHPLRAPLATDVEPTLHQPLRTSAERLIEINKRLNSSLSVELVLAHAIDAAIELTGAERGFILLDTADETGRLHVAIARNLDRERIGRSHLKFSHSIAEGVITSGEPVLTTDARGDARFRENASVHAMRLTSVVSVPIIAPKGVLGAIYLDNRFERGRFSESDLKTLVACADQVAIALENARLHDALARRTEELERERARVEELLRERETKIARLEAESLVQREALSTRYGYAQIIGRGPAMQRVLSTLDRVIESPLSVLIQGESGTGKELVARAIHFEGGRSKRPFVAVNCAALPDTLLEGELFGWVRGAFTGADRDREGLFARGRGGTVFLDEIGETSPAMQAKLLRALQEGEVRPLGSTEVVDLDIRIVAATNRILRDEVSSGRFREDLYYRLAVVELTVPPLRDRREDIAAIAAAIMGRLADAMRIGVPELHPDAARALLRHAWPGNVRELENVLSRAIVLSDGDVVRVEDLGLREVEALPRSRTEFEEDEGSRILSALKATDWNVSEVSRRLGIPRNTLYRKLERYGLRRDA